MAKLPKVNFSRGMYGELEPRLLGEGFAAFIHNAVIDSGALRPIKGPVAAGNVPQWTSANVSASLPVPQYTVQAFEFRGVWYFSASRRGWAAERVGSQDRVYWADGTRKPQKIINGSEVDLGLRRPANPLFAKYDRTTQIGEPTVRAVVSPQGKLIAGDYAYRIGLWTGEEGAYMGQSYEPGAIYSVRLEARGYIVVEWPSLAGTNFTGKIAVYGRKASDIAVFYEPGSTEQGFSKTSMALAPMAVISDLDTHSWTDDGSVAASKLHTALTDLVTREDQLAGTDAYRAYFYTFYRITNGHLDESGPSPVIEASGSGYVTLSRVAYEANGPFLVQGHFEESATNLLSIAASPVGPAITSVYDDPFSDFTYVTVDPAGPAHGLSAAQNIGIVYKEWDSWGFTWRKRALDGAVVSLVTQTPSVNPANIIVTSKKIDDTYYSADHIPNRVYVDYATRSALLVYKIAAITGGGMIGTCATTAVASAGQVTLGTGAVGSYEVTLQWPAVAGATKYGIWVLDILYSTERFIGLVNATKSSGVETWIDTGKRETGVSAPGSNTTASHVFKIPKSLNAAALTAGMFGGSQGWVVTNKTFTLTASNPAAIPAAITPGKLMDFTGSVLVAAPGQFGVAFGAAIGMPTGVQAVQSVVGGVITMSGIAPEAYAPTVDSIVANHLKIPYGTTATASTPLDTTYGWKIYKTTLGKDWGLMATLPQSVATWSDTGIDLPGAPPDSYYEADGITVEFDVPPTTLTGPCLHNGILAGLDGSDIRWTPVNRSDAWPKAFKITVGTGTPYKLVSAGDSLLVICSDGIRRLDFMSPTRVRLSDTLTKYGCIAPHTVQVTTHGVIFLGLDGLMLFNPSTNSCVKVAGDKLLRRFFYSPSAATVTFPHWWLPFNKTHAYAYLLRNEPGTTFRPGMVAQLDNIVTTSGQPFLEARSWYQDGKYYLYWVGASFAHHGTVCVDMTVPDGRITHLGVHPLDAVVSGDGRCFWMLGGVGDDVANTVVDGSTLLATATALESAAPATDTGLGGFVRRDDKPSLFTWHPQVGPAVNLGLDTGPWAAGSPYDRKKWQQVEFHGQGQASVRVWLDGSELTSGGASQVEATESPSHLRKLNLPRSCWGYTARFQASGPVSVYGLEIVANAMPSES